MKKKILAGIIIVAFILVAVIAFFVGCGKAPQEEWHADDDTEENNEFNEDEDGETSDEEQYDNVVFSEGLEYTIENGSCTITGIGTCTDTEIYIPEKIENWPVTTIGVTAFAWNKQITKVVIPYGVICISNYAFHTCDNLTNITIPSSVVEIGQQAFLGCGSLKSLYVKDIKSWLNVDLAESSSHPLWSAGGNLYIDDVLVTDVKIPGSISSIGSYAFYNCESIENVTISDGVTSIGVGAFEGCSGLAGIVIPNSVTNIGDFAFNRCGSLVSLTIPDKVVGIGRYVFEECDSLISVVIPDGVTSIGELAFYGCDSLTSVAIPDSVTSIGGSAFGRCSSLATVYYVGNRKEWSNIPINKNDRDNLVLLNAVRWYSETQPTESGNYWHYVDGKPTPW